MGDVTTEEMNAIVAEGRNQRLKDEALEDYVRNELLKAHDHLASEMVVRNGHRYNALDYLVLDLNSYGQS